MNKATWLFLKEVRTLKPVFYHRVLPLQRPAPCDRRVGSPLPAQADTRSGFVSFVHVCTQAQSGKKEGSFSSALFTKTFNEFRADMAFASEFQVYLSVKAAKT